MDMIKSCIFDLDGVIVDTARYHYLAWKELAQEWGYELTREDNERLKGVGRMESLEIILSLSGQVRTEEEREQLAARKNEQYVQWISGLEPDEILPGALDLLEWLRAHGYGIALASASKNTSLILDRLGIRNCFDVIVDGNQITRSKPDPEVFLLAAEQLNTPVESCLVFEDAASGVEAALQAGMYSVGVGVPAQLWRASFILPDLSDIAAIQRIITQTL